MNYNSKNKDKTYMRLITSNDWAKTRKSKIKGCPLCERCKAEGVDRAATEVHHIKPVESGRTEFEKKQLCFAPANLQSLCHEHHVQAHIELASHKAETKAERVRAESKDMQMRLFGE